MPDNLSLTSHQWLLLESDDTPMHFGALMVFRLPKNHDDNAMAELGRRFRDTPAVAPWNRKRGGAFGTAWETCDVDIDYHCRRSALPSPGGERELGELVSRLHSIALDLDRPLWECHLIEGLYDNQFAVYFKVHPALMGAQRFFDHLTRCLAAGPRKRDIPPWWAVPAQGWQRSSWSERAVRNLQDVPRIARSLPALWRRMRNSGNSGALRKPFNTSRSALNTRINHQRRLATQHYDAARVERLAARFNASPTELLLYLCGAVLRRFFKEYNALPDTPLVAGLLDAAADDRLYREIDLVNLGTHSHDPMTRLTAVRRSLQASRRFLSDLPAPLVPTYSTAMIAPFLLHQRSPINLFPPLFNVPIASLAGPDKAVYLDGAKLVNLWPMSPLLQTNALSISWMYYAGRIHVGFSGARDALPHLQRMAVYMGQSMEQLESLLETEHE